MTPKAKAIWLTVTLPNFVVPIGFVSWPLWMMLHHLPLPRIVGLAALSLVAVLCTYTQLALLRIRRLYGTGRGV